MKGWCVNLMHHPFRFMNQYVTAIGFSVREIVSRSCRGCRKAARVAMGLLPAGHHLYLAVALSEAKPTEK